MVAGIKGSSLCKRGKYWYFWYTTASGKRKKVSTKATTKAEALTFVQGFTLPPGNIDQPKVMLSEFQAQYLSHIQGTLTKKTVSTYRSALNQFTQYLQKDKPMVDISTRDASQFLSKKALEISLWSANRIRIALRSAFRTAVEWDIVTTNVFDKTKNMKTPELSPEFFSRDAWEAFYDVVTNLQRRDLYFVGVTTGMRFGELRALKWDHVNLVKKTIFVRNVVDGFISKSKRQRVIPIPDETVAVLKKRHNESVCGWVFHYNDPIRQITEATESHKFKMYVKRATRKVNGEDVPIDHKLHFHSLRHTYASWLVQSGVSLYAVQKLLGHSTSKMTEVYAHLAPTELSKEVATLSSFLTSANEDSQSRVRGKSMKLLRKAG